MAIQRSVGMGAFLAAIGFLSSAGAQVSSESDGNPPRLVEQLGVPSFASREAAVRRLREIGLPALPALLEGAKHRNLEIRYRSKRLLQEVEQIDHERRVAEFDRNPEAADDDLLPGLRRFRQNVGSDTSSLRLFAEMHRAEPQLYRLSAQGGEPYESRYDQRCGDLRFDYNQVQRRQKFPERLSAILFLGSDPRLGESDQSASILYSLVHSNEFRSAVGNSTAEAAAHRKILGMWVGRPGAGLVYQRLMLAMQFDVREGLAPAVEMLKGPGIGLQAQYALLAVGRFGSREQLDVVQKHLSDTTVLTTSTVNNMVTYTSQLRDVALAVALHLTEQNAASYGFKDLQKHPQFLFQPNRLGFANAADRENAHRRWRAWRDAHLSHEPATAEIPALEELPATP